MEEMTSYGRKLRSLDISSDSDIMWLVKFDEPYCVIGYMDAYGAIHHKLIPRGKESDWTHEHFWPTQTHKRWRFNLREWALDNSPLSKDKLTREEASDVIDFLRKRYNPPLWVIKGEEWEALGRPREGKAYERHCRRWERIYKRLS